MTELFLVEADSFVALVESFEDALKACELDCEAAIETDDDDRVGVG